MRRVGFLISAVLATMILVQGLPSARADVHLPANLEASRREAWEQIIQSIPGPLKPTRDVWVREASDKEIADLVREDPDQSAKEDNSIVDGLYYLDEKKQPTIVLLRSLKGEDAQLVFAHELGHLVWETRLGRGERRSYSSVYQQAKASKHLVTSYAEDSLDEGFAEAFSFFVVKPDTLRQRDTLSFDALSKLAGGGK